MKKLNRIIGVSIALSLTLQPTISKASVIENLIGFFKPNSLVMEDHPETDPIFTTGIDVSKTGDGSVIARLSEDQTTLTISGTGEMKNWWNSNDVPWIDYKNNITTGVIQEGVTSIGAGTFIICRNLTNVNIANSVTIIETAAFWGCQSLENITIPDNVTRIGNKAFLNCTALTNITIPASVTYIIKEAFDGCERLISINVDEKNADYSSEDGVLFNKEKTELIKYPEGRNQSEFIIPNSVTRIKEGAFSFCNYLKSLTISRNVSELEGGFIYYCYRLTNINAVEENTKYSSKDGVLFNKNKTEIVKYPEGKQQNEYIIPDGVTSIGEGAFALCDLLYNVTIPNSVNNIEDGAFPACYSLTNINIPNSVTNIGKSAFSSCYSLTNFKIPNSLETIGDNSFDNSTITIAISIDEDKEEQEIMPEIVERALNKEDMLYATNAFTLTNCKWNEDKSKIIINTASLNDKKITIKINNGKLKDLTIQIVPSGKVTYYSMSTIVYSTLHIADGETITNNNGSNIHIFTENGEFTYNYVTADGEEKYSTASVDNILNIESSKYEIDDYNLIISNISPKTSVEELKNNITTNKTEIEIYDQNENKIDTATETIGTGMSLYIDGISYELSVSGDVNGDGQANIKDILRVNRHRLNRITLQDVYYTAADVNNDGNVNIKDILRINRYRLGRIDSF